jgi:glycogen(starch) synthase
MKVLVLSNLYPPDTVGGYELGCRQAVDALRARGHDVRVLTSAPRTPVETPPHVFRALQLTDLWDFYSDARTTSVALHLKESEAFQVNAFNVHALLATLREFEPDVVYVWMLVGIGGLGMLACLHHLKVPWVWHLMDDVPAKLCTLFYRVQPDLAREFSRQFRGTFLACSRQLVDQMSQSGITLGDRVEMIPNWVTGPRPRPRRSFDRGDRLRIVTAAAFLDRGYDKGIDLLIRAAGLLREGGVDRFSVDIYGKATDGYYAGLIQAHGLSDHVRLRGSLGQAELIDVYPDYDVFAFPGRPDEPFGFAPLEALGRGCVPVIHRRCGAAEWLVHGVHCLKVARDASSFAGAFRRVLDGAVALEPIARRGQEVVWRDLHIDALLPRIERALADASVRSRAGAGTADEAYRLAVLAGKLSDILMQEPFAA